MNKEEVFSELETWKHRFDDIFKLFDNPSEDMSENENLKVISDRYSELKRKIVEYDTQLQKSDNSGKLSECAASILAPAIHEATLHCSARKGSMDKNELSSSLYDGSDYISYYLSQIYE